MNQRYTFEYPAPEMGFLDLIWNYKFHLAFYIVLISTVTFIGLYLIGGVPAELRTVDSTVDSTDSTEVVQNPTQNGTAVIATGTAPVRTVGELPTRIIIDKIGVNTAVLNPTSNKNSVLDENLLKGAVRYPGSGTLGNGNVFLFGHSTGIRIVNNQAFKAFNNLKSLNPND